MAVRNPLYLTSVYTNLLTYSEQFDNAYWSKLRATITADATTAPDGTTTADKLIQAAGQTSNGLIQTPWLGLNVVDTQSYTVSIFAKKGTDRNYLALKETLSTGGGGVTQWFNLNTGALATLAPGSATSVAAISDEGNGWYRCSIKFTANATRTGGIMITVAENDGNTTNTDDQGFIYLWGAQFEEGSLATSYIPTTTTTKSAGGDFKEMTTAMVNEIVDQTVYQYSLSPSVALSVVSSGGSLGALADTRLQAGAVSTSNTSFPNEATTQEPSAITINNAKITSADASVSPTADTGKTWPLYLTSVYTNLFTYSEQFNSGWVKPNVTITADNTTAPNGTTTADKVQQNSGQTNADLANIQKSGLTSTSGKNYTISIYAKVSANRNFLMINDHISENYFRKTWFNLSTGTVGTTYSSHTASISDEGDGWYRCSITVTSTVTNTDSIIMFSPTETDGTPTVTDNEGSLFYWGAQLEENQLTSYIPTTTTTKSAGGDFKSMSLTDIKDTFLHPAIDLLVSGSTGTQQGGTYHISTATSVGGSTEVSGSNTPVFTDTRADTSLYSAAGLVSVTSNFSSGGANGQAIMVLSTLTGILVGQTVFGTNVPANTTVSSINSGAVSVTLSANFTGQASGTYTFVGEIIDQPTTITNYYLHKITGSDTSYTLPIFTTATNQIQSYPEATFESLLQEWIRYTSTSSGDGYEINYSYSTGTNRGSGMVDTVLNGTGDYQTLQVSDDYRAQEFPNGTSTTANTFYLKINKS